MGSFKNLLANIFKSEYSEDFKKLNTEHIVSSAILDQFGINLSEQLSTNGFDPVIGRDTEIDEVIEVLLRKTKNNPVLIGEPGVGKTAVAEGLTQRILNRQVPKALMDKQIFSFDITRLLSDSRFRGDMERNLKAVLSEIKTLNNVIVFIDEIHIIVNAGVSKEGNPSIGNLLKPALARGQFLCIGATTLDEYPIIEKDSALERRFMPVRIGEPSIEATIHILKELCQSYETHHEVFISQKAIETAVTVSNRFIKDRYFPDKAIDLIDRACVLVKLRNKNRGIIGSKERKIHSDLNNLVNLKNIAVENEDYELAYYIKKLEDRTRKEMYIRIQNQTNFKKAKPENDFSFEKFKDFQVHELDVMEVAEKWTGIPVTTLTKDETSLLLNMNQKLNEHIIGQPEAVRVISNALKRSRVGLNDPNRPIASFLFCGPTGVGKTQIAKTLARYLFKSEKIMIRLDMSEFMLLGSTARLIGTPGNFENKGGILTEAVRKNPYSILLLDELEKAHPEVFNLFLQILEDGRLTDVNGRTIDFTNVIIVMTSNIGAQVIQERYNGGIQSDEFDMLFNTILNMTFKPEFINRLDDYVIFEPLTKDNITEIADALLKSLAQRLVKKGICLNITTELRDHLINKGYNPTFGARPLRRAISSILESFLADKFLSNELKANDTVTIDYNYIQNKLEMKVEQTRKKTNKSRKN